MFCEEDTQSLTGMLSDLGSDEVSCSPDATFNNLHRYGNYSNYWAHLELGAGNYS